VSWVCEEHFRFQKSRGIKKSDLEKWRYHWWHKNYRACSERKSPGIWAFPWESTKT